MSIIIFLFILAGLILAHEFGHFIVAKRSGIRVDEFGIGFPPRVFGRKKGETIYSVNWIPFGGFVKIFGEDPSPESLTGPDSARSLVSKPRYTQAAVIGAGVAFNFFLGWILLVVSFMSTGPSVTDAFLTGSPRKEEVVVVSTIENSPAAEAGFLTGDRITGVESGGQKLGEPTTIGIHNFIVRHGEEKIIFSIRREDDIVPITVMPIRGVLDGDEPAIGIEMRSIMEALPVHRAIFEAGKTAFNLTGVFAIGFITLIGNILTGSANFAEISGPVGIVSIGSQAVGISLSYLLSFTALISINLAVLNLFPIPALDGGRLFFMLIEIIKRSPMKPKVINMVNTASFILLILLMLFITYGDVIKLVRVAP